MGADAANDIRLNPATQYEADVNLAARQRLWDHQAEPFDLVGWVFDLAAPRPGDRVLDVGCGNGRYVWTLQEHAIDAVGCDLSMGMLRSVGPHPRLVNGDVERLPIATDSVDIVLAPHMMYHVTDRLAAAAELRRVLRPGGVCVVVTNGAEHTRSLRDVVEHAARETNPGWDLRSPSTHIFSLDNGAAQMESAFEQVRGVRPEGIEPVVVVDPAVVADYVGSIRDHYEHEVDRPWVDVVEAVRREVAEQIAVDGSFTVMADVGAFVCT